MLLFRALFCSVVGNHYWNKGEPVLKENHFSASGNRFFPYYGNIFFNKHFIPCNRNRFFDLNKPFLYIFFRGSYQWNLLCPLKTYFLTNPSFQILGRIFSLVETVCFTWKVFSSSEKPSLIRFVICVLETHFLVTVFCLRKPLWALKSVFTS